MLMPRLGSRPVLQGLWDGEMLCIWNALGCETIELHHQIVIQIKQGRLAVALTCSGFDIPGIGIMTGDFLRSHASAIRPGVTPSRLAADARGLPALARVPVASMGRCEEDSFPIPAAVKRNSSLPP